MARLGSVLGALLAEMTRARVIADQLTADLVREYEGDPVLAAMNVPRVTIGEATVTVRYTVDQLETPSAAEPDLNKAKANLNETIEARVLPRVLANMNVEESVAAEVAGSIGRRAKPPAVPQLRTALAGDLRPAVRASTESALEIFDELPPATRRKIGTKAEFRNQLERAVTSEVERVIGEASRRATLDALLSSTLDVSVTKDELPEDPSRIQELTLTLRGEDLDLVLRSEGS